MLPEEPCKGNNYNRGERTAAWACPKPAGALSRQVAMSVSAKDIMEELARSRGFFHRHEVLRAMLSLVQALKGMQGAPIFGHAKTQIVGMVTEMVQHLSRTEEVKRFRPTGLQYDRGQEKKLMAEVVAVLKKIKQEQDTETPEQIRERKLKLDRAIIRGQKLLGVGKLKDAMAMFNESLKFYVDEHMVFFHIGNKLAAAKQYQAALKFLLKGTEKAPKEALMFKAAAYSLFHLKKVDQAAKYMNQAMKLGASGVENHTLFALILEKKGMLKVAAQQLEKALDINPTYKDALKASKRIQKALAASATS